MNAAPSATRSHAPVHDASSTQTADASPVISSGPTQSADPKVHERRWWILAVLCLSLLIVGIDGTIVNVALPSFVRELGASTSQLQWISDAYTLAFASLLLTAGTLGDRFGRKGSLLLGLTVFGFGSLASSMAGSANVLIATRALQGIGGAFIMPATLSILTNVFDDRERGRAIGIWAGMSGLGVAVGPITGGWLLDHFWWGSIFMVNLPIVVLAIVGAITLVPTSKDPAGANIDVVGTVLSIAMLVALLYGIIQGSSLGWTSPTIIGAFVGGTLLLTAFVAWERHTEHPMLDVGFFANPRFSAASVAVTLVFFAMFGSMFFLTQYLQFVLGYSPLKAGVGLVPVAVVLMIAAPVSTFLVARFGTKVIVTVGLVAVAAALFLMSRTTLSSGYALVAVVLVVLGLGMGIAMAPATDSIMGSLPPSKAGVGSAVNDTTRELGGALGVAVLGSLTSATYASHLAHSQQLTALGNAGPQGASAAAAVRSSIGGASMVAGSLPADTARTISTLANNAFVSALDHTVIVGGVIALFGAVVALLFLPSRSGRLDDAEVGALGDALEESARRLPADVAVPIDPSRPAAAPAFLRLLSEAGFSSLSFHGVATRAGLSTATLEREWTSKVDVVIRAVEQIFAENPVPDTGSFAGDCEAYATEVAASLTQPGTRVVVAALINDAAHDAALGHALHDRLLAPRREAAAQIVHRAAQRGEVADGLDPDVVIDALIAPLYHRILVTGAPITERAVQEIVAVTLHGVRSNDRASAS
jgi:EmrB/QacA subfamily drug resistance transporter